MVSRYPFFLATPSRELRGLRPPRLAAGWWSCFFSGLETEAASSLPSDNRERRPPRPWPRAPARPRLKPARSAAPARRADDAPLRLCCGLNEDGEAERDDDRRDLLLLLLLYAMIKHNYVLHYHSPIAYSTNGWHIDNEIYKIYIYRADSFRKISLINNWSQ